MKTPMMIGILLLLASAIPAKAQLCGPDVKHSTKGANGKSPLETSPPAGKALVYVLSPHYGVGRMQMKVSADRVWIGVNQAHRYFVAALDPGTHYFCAEYSKNATHLKLAVEAGKSYFLLCDPDVLQELMAEEAAVLLVKCKRMEFFEKK